MNFFRKLLLLILRTYMVVSLILAIVIMYQGLKGWWILLYNYTNDINPSALLETVKIDITIASALFVSSALVYSLVQFIYQQKQNRLSVFEKIFYNRLDYLDGTILKELKYQHPALEFINDRRQPEKYAALQREAFLYFNELFKRKYCNEDTEDNFIAANKTKNERNEFLKDIADKFSNFIAVPKSNAVKTFEMYYQNFQQIVLIIDDNNDLNDADKIKYFDILYQQTNEPQKIHLGLMMLKRQHCTAMFDTLQKYPQIYNSYVKDFPYSFTEIDIVYKKNYL